MIHTTNGRMGTQFENEVNYLIRSDKVGAHFVVSKSGEIVQILDPDKFTAWHAGATSNAKYGNTFAVGVEVHYTRGEGQWTGYMWDAITKLALEYKDCEPVTHRGVAIPVGRKIDPSGVSDYWFEYWKLNRFNKYMLMKTQTAVNVRERPSKTSPIVDTLKKDFAVFSFVNDRVEGQEISQGQRHWRYILGLGYIYEPLLVQIPPLE
jgi:N-acetyl-anhydromuramyl-L-alanine amidase AmpD